MAKVADESVHKKDYILRMVNLLEALQDSHQDAKSYRTHCLEFNARAQKLRDPLNQVLAADPSFGLSEDARNNLHVISNTLEDGIIVIRKCSQLTSVSKLLDYGNTKGRLEELTAFLDQDVPKAEAYLHSSTARLKSMKRHEKLQALKQGTRK